MTKCGETLETHFQNQYKVIFFFNSAEESMLLAFKSCKEVLGHWSSLFSVHYWGVLLPYFFIPHLLVKAIFFLQDELESLSLHRD